MEKALYQGYTICASDTQNYGGEMNGIFGAYKEF